MTRCLRAIATPFAVATCLIASLASAQSPVPANKPANFPSWWFSRDVIARTSATATPSWPSDYPASDDYAAIATGQLKNLASKALLEMEETLPNGIWNTTPGQALISLVLGWNGAGDNYAGVNNGQLKELSRKFYDVLAAAGYTAGNAPAGWSSGTYPWSSSSDIPDNYAVAAVGQAKYLFSFDLKYDSEGGTGDGLADWWELHYFGDLDETGAGDTDSDGVDNLTEMLQGRNPTVGAVPDTTGEIGLVVFTPFEN